MLPYTESLVIIPTYNEVANIDKMIETLFSLYPDISLLIVDDSSPDGTAQAVRESADRYPGHLFLLERKSKQGIGTAYTDGFKWALSRDYNYIFEMDCDFSHDPQDVARLLESACGADLAIGSRYKDGVRIINWSFKRLFLSYFACLYTRIVTGIPLADTTGGFKCFTRKALESLNLDNIVSNGYIFQLELNYKIWAKGMRIVEVPIVFHERRKGKSKMNNEIIVEALFKVIQLRFKRMMGILHNDP